MSPQTDDSLPTGQLRLFSEADRSSTCLLLPSEY